MVVWRTLFSLFNSKNNFLIQLILFSLSGIQALCFNVCISSSLGTFYSSYLGYAPNNVFQVELCLVVAIMITMYIAGYGLTSSGCILKNEKVHLPDITLSIYPKFLKLIPLLLVWGIYFYITIIFIHVVANLNRVLLYFYYFLLILFVPFVFTIFVEFSKDFRYQRKFFACSSLILNIKKCFPEVVKCIINIFIMFLLFFTMICLMFYFSDFISNGSIKLGMRLFALSLMFYMFNLLYLTYTSSLAIFLKEKGSE